MTVLDARAPGGTPAAQQAGSLSFPLGFDTILEPSPLQFLDEHGALVDGGLRPDAPELEPAALLEAYRAMVVGRRFDVQATTLVRQGRLAVYPSSFGQEACEIGAMLALRPTDWLFPTYRDCSPWSPAGSTPSRRSPCCAATRTAATTRRSAAPPRSARRWRPRPRTPPAWPWPPVWRGDDTVALAFCGDGGTSEGDFHEALNFAAVYQAPAVFFVQNNGYAISVPLSRQTHAARSGAQGRRLRHGRRPVDGNDILAVRHVVAQAAERARRGEGPTLIEAVTYRMQAHTNADDADPLPGRGRGGLLARARPAGPPGDLPARGRAADRRRGEAGSRGGRGGRRGHAGAARRGAGRRPDRDLFAHVYAAPTPQLLEQAAGLQAELDAESEAAR